MTAEVLRSMRLWSGEYEIESEMLVKTARKHFTSKKCTSPWSSAPTAGRELDRWWMASKSSFHIDGILRS
jgi:hypothetical protein